MHHSPEGYRVPRGAGGGWGACSGSCSGGREGRQAAVGVQRAAAQAG